MKPTKTGWYRARWPRYGTWACVLVTVTGSEASVYDPGVARWRPLTDVSEWGRCIDDLEAELTALRNVIENLRADLRIANATIESLEAELTALRGYFVAMTHIADDAHRRCEELREPPPAGPPPGSRRL